jgi:hypothetical protein
MTLQYFYPVPRTDLPNHVSQPYPNIPSQCRLAVLRDEYKVVVTLVRPVR